MRIRSMLAMFMTGALIFFPQQGWTEEKTDDESTAKVVILDKVMVIGSPAEAEGMPGSAHVVTKEDIRQQSYDDVSRVLRKVPGVYTRSEFGFGLFPSISLRGVDTTRSAKVTIMEDGILMAPAPYSAPAAYFAPTVGRMSGMEVLMGSSQIKYGPHITGGVINFLATPIPRKKTVYMKAQYGDFNELRAHAYVGNTIETAQAGRFGFLFEGYARMNDGFKTIDQAPDFRDGDDTGFTKPEPMIKLSWEPPTAFHQRLEFQYGQTELDANEGYLGLSEADFQANPFRRYTASRFDNITSTQRRTYLRYGVAPTENLDIITTLYYTNFKRNWYKLKDIRNVNGNTLGLSGALAGAQNGEGLACLKGSLACTLRVRANNRSYNTKGIESVAYYRFGTGAVQQEITAGFRYHRDQVRRFQQDDDFVQAANGAITSMAAVGQPGDAGNRLQKTKALALYAQDSITIGKLSVIPGVRYERLDQTFEDYLKPANSGTATQDMVAGGIGVVYQFNDLWTGFGGVHRGFSPPSPNGAVTNGLKEETSTAFEAGARYKNPRQALGAEAVVFFTRFEDLIVIDNIGGVGTGLDENFGVAHAYGLEFSGQYDPGVANGWTWRNPWYVTFTYTNATQQNDARSTDAESIFSFGKKGNKMPYIPEYQFNFGTGVETDQWGAFLTGTYVGETFTTASNVENQVNGNGSPDARFGKTDSYFIADISGFYQVTDRIRVIGGVQNLFDAEYIVSRQPHGPRPGMPRFAYGGMEVALW